MLKNVVFLDRDGVINVDSEAYIKNWSEFQYIPGSVDAIAALCQHGFDPILITNQSMINRRMVPFSELLHMFFMMTKSIEEKGGALTDIFFCPHIDADQCQCRKPKPGLIFQACAKYNIDLKASYMIGDSLRDIQCGINAGCGRIVLVRTGNGQTAQDELRTRNIEPDYIAEDLADAVNWIVGNS